MRIRRWLIVEGVVVFVVILVLVVVMIPTFYRLQGRAILAESMHNQAMLAHAIHTMYAERHVMLIDLWDDDTDMGHRIINEAHFGVGGHSEQNRWMCDILAPLTTPTPYLAELPLDPWRLENRREWFQWPGEDFYNPGAEGYLYIDNDPILDRDGAYRGWRYGNVRFNGKLATHEPGAFLLIGLSPWWHVTDNQVEGEVESRLEIQGLGITNVQPANAIRASGHPSQIQYDITNGLYSMGEIMYRGLVRVVETPEQFAGPFTRMVGGF